MLKDSLKEKSKIMFRYRGMLNKHIKYKNTIYVTVVKKKWAFYFNIDDDKQGAM